MKQKPKPPFPKLVRKPPRSFGWIDDRLRREDWLPKMGPEALSVFVLLSLASDRSGSSYYGREQMARSTGLTRREIDEALRRLLQLELVAHRPWREGHVDGVWQLLPIPTPESEMRTGPITLGDAINKMTVG